MTYLIAIDNNSKSYFERGNENIKNRKCFISLEERENHKKTILQQINSN